MVQVCPLLLVGECGMDEGRVNVVAILIEYSTLYAGQAIAIIVVVKL